jgi:hypothetical protein
MPSNNWGPYFAQSTVGETATETFLSTFGETEPQQGSPVLNAPNSFSGVLPPNAVNSYRWE